MNNFKYISEKDVETKLIQPIFLDVLKFLEKDMFWQKPVNLTFGREKKKKFADLVVYHKNKPVIVVEAKKPTESLKSGLDQLDSYAFALKCPFGFITNGKSLILRGYYSFNSRINIIEHSVEDLRKERWDSLKKLISIENISASIGEKANVASQPDEEQINDYRRFFRGIHNIIRDNEKLDPAASFDELSKLLFLKAAEDEWSSRHQGEQILTIEKIEEWEKIGKADDYVNQWFRSATKEFYSDVFEENTKINISTKTLKEILKRMRGFHIKNGDVDIKGRAYEEFLPSQLRGKGLGQFFTPRPIVNFMADMAEISMYDSVVDFACGSGGFLIKSYEQMSKLVEEVPSGMWKRLDVKREDFLEGIKTQQIYGIDAEPRAARTAKMNMLMWGDGKKVVRANALSIFDYNENIFEPKEYDPQDSNSGCTLILANPPFGSKEKEEDILNRYELGSQRELRNSQKTEILFLEKGLKLLKPQGKMLIIIPQGILSNESYQYVRDYIQSQAEIRAIITLPTHSFVQSGVQTVKTCVLYLQKFTEEKQELYQKKVKGLSSEERRDLLKKDEDFRHKIFMGTSEFIGYEPSGRSIMRKNEKTDLDLLVEDFKNKELLSKIKIDLVEFANNFYGEKSSKRSEQVIRGTVRGLKTSFLLESNQAENRLDPTYYIFKQRSEKMLKKFIDLKGKIKEIKEKFKPQNDLEMDKEYPILSVTNDGKITLNEYRKGEDFTQAYKKVTRGDLVYNPYRVNIGSIGIVPDEFEEAYVSPAYIAFQVLGINPDYLLTILRTPFFKMYIDVLSTGSIRDSLSFDLLESIKVPMISGSEEKKLLNAINRNTKDLDALGVKVNNAKSKNIDFVNKKIFG